MKSLLVFLLAVIGFGFLLLRAVELLPVNDRPCFGKTKDGHLRWHSSAECAH